MPRSQSTVTITDGSLENRIKRGRPDWIQSKWIGKRVKTWTLLAILTAASVFNPALPPTCKILIKTLSSFHIQEFYFTLT